MTTLGCGVSVNYTTYSTNGVAAEKFQRKTNDVPCELYNDRRSQAEISQSSGETKFEIYTRKNVPSIKISKPYTTSQNLGLRESIS